MNQVRVDVVTSPGCAHCQRFMEFWETEKTKWPDVIVRDISVTTPEGQALAGKHMIFASPGIIINGELWATGGFDKDTFVTELGRRLSHA